MADIDGEKKKAAFLAVVMVALLGYLAYDYVYRPRAQEVAVLQERLDRLQAQNRAAREIAGTEGRSEVERRLAVYREQLARVEGLIPSSEELPDLLDAISAEAQRTGVDLALIQPVGATSEQFYTRRTYALGVLGSYHQIGEFLTSIASLRRIITPIGLNVTVSGDAAEPEPRLEAKFEIETYVLPSTELPSPTVAAQDSARAE